MQEHASRREAFSLTAGGPLYRVLSRLRLRTTARSWWLGFALWLPLAIGESVRAARGEAVDPMMLDLSVHVRLLLTLPLLLHFELLLDQTAKSAMASFYHGQFCDPAPVDRIVDRAYRLRDAWLPELLMAGVAILGGQLVLWGVVGSTGVFHGGAAAASSGVERVWYCVVALPIVQFVIFRWLWRWVMWGQVLARIARLPLSLLATHADHACGLSALARPVTGFSGFTLATSAILSAAWGTQLLEHRTTLAALLPMVVTFLVAALLIAVGPLLVLSGPLFRARRRTLAQYGDFVRAYTLGFHAKWITPASPEPVQPLGSPDIQSLNDLGEAFQVASKSRVFAFGPRNVFTVWFAGALPMLPLLLSTLTFEQVLSRIISTVLGGLPV